MPYSCSDTCDTCDGLRAKFNAAENEDERSKLEKELQNHLGLAEQCLCKDCEKAEHRGHKLDRALCAYNTILYNYYGAIVQGHRSCSSQVCYGRCTFSTIVIIFIIATPAKVWLTKYNEYH